MYVVNITHNENYQYYKVATPHMFWQAIECHTKVKGRRFLCTVKFAEKAGCNLIVAISSEDFIAGRIYTKNTDVKPTDMPYKVYCVILLGVMQVTVKCTWNLVLITWMSLGEPLTHWGSLCCCLKCRKSKMCFTCIPLLINKIEE